MLTCWFSMVCCWHLYIAGALRQVLPVHLVLVPLYLVAPALMLAVTSAHSRHLRLIVRSNMVFHLLNLTKRFCPSWKSICTSVISRYFSSFVVHMYRVLSGSVVCGVVHCLNHTDDKVIIHQALQLRKEDHEVCEWSCVGHTVVLC